MRSAALCAALVVYAAAAAAADNKAVSGVDLFEAACLQTAPDFDSREAADMGAATHVESKSGRFCKVVTRADAAVDAVAAERATAAFAQRMDGKVIRNEVQDGGRAFAFHVQAGGDRFVLLFKNEGPKQFFMVKRTGP